MSERNKYTTEQQVYLTYTFNAPRELVFKAWTNPEWLVKWFAPHGCTIVYKHIEMNEGGTYHSCIYDPVHGECWCKGVYSKILFPELFEFTMVICDKQGNTVLPAEAGMPPEWPVETFVSIRFLENQGKTNIELRQSVSQNLAIRTGAYPSWIKMMERLQDIINND